MRKLELIAAILSRGNLIKKIVSTQRKNPRILNEISYDIYAVRRDRTGKLQRWLTTAVSQERSSESGFTMGERG